VGGDATEGLPAVDEGVAGDTVAPSDPSPEERDGPPKRDKSSDHLDHDKLSRLIPGYVKPDGTKTRE
jgi:hypothetical protein